MNDPFEVLTNPPPSVSESAAAATLHSQYGISGHLRPQVSERDQNYMVRMETGDACVLKIANSAETPEITDFQNKALLHIERVDPDLPVPRLVRTLDGDEVTAISSDDGRGHVARVLTWLEGTPLRFVEPTPDNADQLGVLLARTGLALKGFEHPASDYNLLWDVKRADSLGPLLQHVADSDLKAMCAARLDYFSESIKPALSDLRWQVIYNDLNSSNVLVDKDDPKRFAGIIDFGDMLRSPLVVDVAVAAAYLCGEGAAALDDIRKFLSGYSSVTPLQDDEIALIYDLILMRNYLTILIANWRAARYPENRDYILRNESRARSTVETLTGLGQEKVTDAFRLSCA